MRLQEILNEDTSLTTATRNIVDSLKTELPPLYRQLTTMAENFFRNNGEINRSFNFITGGVKKTWFDTSFSRKLKPSLYVLLKSLPSSISGELSSFLSLTIDEAKFKHIEATLPDILKRIAQSTRNKELLDAAESAERMIEKYYSYVGSLSDDEDDGEVSPQPKKPSAFGAQNAAAESVINDVLAGLDKKTAGEIRNAIARSGNRLQALQAELNKRGLAESILVLTNMLK